MSKPKLLYLVRNMLRNERQAVALLVIPLLLGHQNAAARVQAVADLVQRHRLCIQRWMLAASWMLADSWHPELDAGC